MELCNPEMGLKLYFRPSTLPTAAPLIPRCLHPKNDLSSQPLHMISRPKYFSSTGTRLDTPRPRRMILLEWWGNWWPAASYIKITTRWLSPKLSNMLLSYWKKSGQCKMVTLFLNLFFIREEDVSLPPPYRFIVRRQRRAPILFARPNFSPNSLTHIFSTPLPL